MTDQIFPSPLGIGPVRHERLAERVPRRLGSRLDLRALFPISLPEPLSFVHPVKTVRNTADSA